MRIGSGIAAGMLADLIFGADYLNGILVGMIVYLATYYFAKYAWYRKLEPEKITKIYSTGIGGFVMMFLFFWILLFTLYSIGV